MPSQILDVVTEAGVLFAVSVTISVVVAAPPLVTQCKVHKQSPGHSGPEILGTLVGLLLSMAVGKPAPCPGSS